MGKFNVEQNRRLYGMDEKAERSEDYEEIKPFSVENKYKHWESEKEAAENRKRVTNYNRKISEVRKTGMQTEKIILERKPEVFDQNARERIEEDLGSNKIEVYDETIFDKKVGVEKNYKILGTHDFEGKIRIRDSESIESLKETAIHETIHDMSYQSVEQDAEKGIVEKRSGIRVLTEWYDKMPDGTVEFIDAKVKNRELNEGLTQLYTVETARELSIQPNPNAYPEERVWAERIRQKVGSDVVEKAYFGGDLDALEGAFNERSEAQDAWNSLNEEMKNYRKYSKLANDARFKDEDKYITYCMMAVASRQGVERLVEDLSFDPRDPHQKRK